MNLVIKTYTHKWKVPSLNPDHGVWTNNLSIFVNRTGNFGQTSGSLTKLYNCQNINIIFIQNI